MKPPAISRRTLLGTSVAGALAAHTSTCSATEAPSGRKRLLRVAHLTDIHIQREAARGLEACFAHVQTPGAAVPGGPPDLVITGGDTVMGYVGRIDDAQFDWFARDLAVVPATKPVLVVSHIPILSVYPLDDGHGESRARRPA